LNNLKLSISNIVAR